MNIFAVQENPRQAARDLCNKHVCKMCMESTQLLCTALHAKGMWQEGMARPYNPNHPAALWVKQSWSNFVWLLTHAQELYDEYERRYGRVHASRTRFRLVVATVSTHVFQNGPLPHWNKHTPFVQCMPKKYQHVDSIQAYRNFYLLDKVRFAKWPRGCTPDWMAEAPVLAGEGVDSAHGSRRDRAPHPGDVRPPGQGGDQDRNRRGQVDGGGEPRPAARPRGARRRRRDD